jgi:SAM-dependent methyltransferase
MVHVRFFSIILSVAFFIHAFLFSECRESNKPETVESRFIVASDMSSDKIAGISLPVSWWSRPYEYAWASQFVGKDLVVLDAACGVSHPFKWLLGSTCKETWACDIDPILQDPDRIFQEVREDLGEQAYQALRQDPSLFRSVRLVCASICSLPSFMPKFDRIFCISTLEHMNPKDQKRVLLEFANQLTPNGLLILTVDYPVVTPSALFQVASEAGLEPVYCDSKEMFPRKEAISLDADGITTNQKLFIYRTVLRLKGNGAKKGV